MSVPWEMPDGSVDWSHPDIPDDMLDLKRFTAQDMGLEPFDRVEYALVPLSVGVRRPPAERLFLVLHFAYRTFPPSAPGGWYRLSRGLYTRAGLEAREKRRRAVNTLAKQGEIEVRRNGTRTTLLRLVNPGPKKVTGARRKP